MKSKIFLFVTLLILWIAGCSYWYVCKIRNDCAGNRVDEASQMVQKSDSLLSDSLKATSAQVAVTIPEMFTVYFNLGKSTCILTDEDKNHIDLIKQYLSQNSSKVVQVTGHADNTGSDQRNTIISYERAAFMKQKLQDAGIDASLIEVDSKSYMEPIADNSSAEGRAKNRRAEIKIK
jgi:outer membrane protein OmpA-like peptidoglycan-associated protein